MIKIKICKVSFALFSDTWTLKDFHCCEIPKARGELQFLSSHPVREKLELHLIFNINIF